MMKVSGKAHIFGAVSKGTAGMSVEQAYASLRKELTAEAKECDVMAAHLEILEDPLLKESISIGISGGMSPESAVKAAEESLKAMFAGIDDEYLRSRTDDISDVCTRLRMKITGESRQTAIPEGCILVADELFPSDMAAIDLTKVRGISSRKGSRTSHIVIMAHSIGIPIDVGADNSSIKEGEYITIDDPDVGSGTADIIRRAGKDVYVNAGSLEDIENAIAAGADGIGLFRTEFLYLNSKEAPTLDIQKEIYRTALEHCKGKVLTVRTMDLGGDKFPLWLDLPPEKNPFLGVRGIRLSLKHPDLLKTQLEALALAAEEVPECRLRIMFPMVCSASEVAQAKELLGEKAESLTFGAMIETPAAALDIESLCEECSFFSIGSNDLVQYVMAADRGSSEVAEYYRPMCPPMRWLIEKIVADAHRCGATVGICGELASNPSSTQFLLQAGVDSISLSKI